MVLHAEQERVRLLLKEAIPLLCKNGLTYNKEFCIEALVGITLDQNDVFLVSIKETVAGDIEVNTEQVESNAGQETSTVIGVRQEKTICSKSKSPRKRRKPMKDQGYPDSDSDQGEIIGDITPVKRERQGGSVSDDHGFHRAGKSMDQYHNSQGPSVNDNEDSDELVVIKCEPPVMGDYCETPSYSSQTSLFETSSTGEQLYSTYPGTSDATNTGLVVSKVTSGAAEVADATSEQSSMVNWIDPKELDYNSLDKNRLLSESNKLMEERMLQRDDGKSSPIWECRVCQKRSNLKTNLRKHVYAIHFKAERYRCKKCGERFLWNGAYIHHKLYCGQKKTSGFRIGRRAVRYGRGKDPEVEDAEEKRDMQN